MGAVWYVYFLQPGNSDIDVSFRPCAPGSENALVGKARESLLKLVIGMACGGYGYDPKASRNKQLPEISGDLSRRGVALDDDTIRKWLREAAEVLPGE